MNEDKRLAAMIDAATEATKSAKNTTDLLTIVGNFVDYKGKLQFEYKAEWQAVLAFAALAIVALAANYLGPWAILTWLSEAWGFTPSTCAWIIAGPSILFVTSTLSYIVRGRNLLPELSKALALRSSRITNGLEEIDTPPEALLRQLQQSFSDYARGNHSRQIQLALKGCFKGPRHTLDYHYIDLEYVDSREQTYTETNSKGETVTRSRTVYHHYRRYSVVVDFPWVQGIAVRSDQQDKIDLAHSYQTTSSAFNRTLTLSGTSAMACARFAKPVTVLHLLTMTARLRNPNLEFAADGAGLCLSFDDDNLIDFRMPGDLSNPGAFYKAVEAGIDLPALTTLLEAIHVLAEQHDDNFESPTSTAIYREH